jgi:hypothetical protein
VGSATYPGGLIKFSVTSSFCELSCAQAYCGHAHISTTMRYVHHAPAVEDAATLLEALRQTPASALVAQPT